MRILVMQQGTGLYLGQRTTWVKHKHLAVQFKTSSEAVDYCFSKGLHGVDLLLHFEDSHWDIRLRDVLSRKPLPKSARKYFPPPEEPPR